MNNDMSFWEKERGILVDEWFDEGINDWKHRIHFDYTEKLMQELVQSDLLAVPSHSGTKGKEVRGILKIIRKQPYDFDLVQLGNVDNVDPETASKIIRKSFNDLKNLFGEERDKDKKVLVYATRTNLSLINVAEDKWKLQTDEQLVRRGGDAQILSEKLLSDVYNNKIDLDSSFSPGKLLGREQVDILLDTTNMITKHAGVFGYTGVGKSNLVSCIISKLLEARNNANVVIFDLEDEYSGLLVDCLGSEKVSGLICFADRDSIPKKIAEYMEGKGDAGSAVKQFVDQMMLPSDLNNHVVRNKYCSVFARMLEDARFRIYMRHEFNTVGAFVSTILGSYMHIEGITSVTGACAKLEKDREQYGFEDFTIGGLENLLKSYEKLRNGEFGSYGPFAELHYEHDVKLIKNWIEELKFKPHEQFQITRNEIIKILSDEEFGAEPELNGKNLFVFQGDDERSLQRLSYDLIAERTNGLYNYRKQKGIISPLTLFVFDEADKFIPQKSSESQAVSREAVETVVRRGRKFGMGALIATQRMNYLDTSVLSQLHTYFVSKLPRKTDREKVTEGFGIGNDVLTETFRFRVGDWLILSNDATGLKNTPIHIHSDNSNIRIWGFLENKKLSPAFVI